MKRLNAPKHWMLAKLGGIWAPRPSCGPHKMRECLPLCIILRNRLKYALTGRESKVIVMRRHIQIDHKIRTDIKFPVGFMDVLTIKKTNENFRMLFDTKGRYVMHDLKKNPKEANFKLCKIKKIGKAKKASIGKNPFMNGMKSAIPYAVTTDGRTLRYPDPSIKANDTIQFDLVNSRIEKFVKFEPGNISYVVRGKNHGRIGIISKIEKHPGAFDVVHLMEVNKKGRTPKSFTTRIDNVFVIGKGDKPWVSLPKGAGIRLSVFEERDIREERQRGNYH